MERSRKKGSHDLDLSPIVKSTGGVRRKQKKDGGKKGTEGCRTGELSETVMTSTPIATTRRRKRQSGTNSESEDLSQKKMRRRRRDGEEDEERDDSQLDTTLEESSDSLSNINTRSSRSGRTLKPSLKMLENINDTGDKVDSLIQDGKKRTEKSLDRSTKEGTKTTKTTGNGRDTDDNTTFNSPKHDGKKKTPKSPRNGAATEDRATLNSPKQDSTRRKAKSTASAEGNLDKSSKERRRRVSRSTVNSTSTEDEDIVNSPRQNRTTRSTSTENEGIVNSPRQKRTTRSTSTENEYSVNSPRQDAASRKAKTTASKSRKEVTNTETSEATTTVQSTERRSSVTKKSVDTPVRHPVETNSLSPHSNIIKPEDSPDPEVERLNVNIIKPEDSPDPEAERWNTNIIKPEETPDPEGERFSTNSNQGVLHNPHSNSSCYNSNPHTDSSCYNSNPPCMGNIVKTEVQVGNETYVMTTVLKTESDINIASGSATEMSVCPQNQVATPSTPSSLLSPVKEEKTDLDKVLSDWRAANLDSTTRPIESAADSSSTTTEQRPSSTIESLYIETKPVTCRIWNRDSATEPRTVSNEAPKLPAKSPGLSTEDSVPSRTVSVKSPISPSTAHSPVNIPPPSSSPSSSSSSPHPKPPAIIKIIKYNTTGDIPGTGQSSSQVVTPVKSSSASGPPAIIKIIKYNTTGDIPGTGQSSSQVVTPVKSSSASGLTPVKASVLLGQPVSPASVHFGKSASPVKNPTSLDNGTPVKSSPPLDETDTHAKPSGISVESTPSMDKTVEMASSVKSPTSMGKETEEERDEEDDVAMDDSQGAPGKDSSTLKTLDPDEVFKEQMQGSSLSVSTARNPLSQETGGVGKPRKKLRVLYPRRAAPSLLASSDSVSKMILPLATTNNTSQLLNTETTNNISVSNFIPVSQPSNTDTTNNIKISNQTPTSLLINSVATNQVSNPTPASTKGSSHRLDIDSSNKGQAHRLDIDSSSKGHSHRLDIDSCSNETIGGVEPADMSLSLLEKSDVNVLDVSCAVPVNDKEAVSLPPSWCPTPAVFSPIDKENVTDNSPLNGKSSKRFSDSPVNSKSSKRDSPKPDQDLRTTRGNPSRKLIGTSARTRITKPEKPRRHERIDLSETGNKRKKRWILNTEFESLYRKVVVEEAGRVGGGVGVSGCGVSGVSGGGVSGGKRSFISELVQKAQHLLETGQVVEELGESGQGEGEGVELAEGGDTDQGESRGADHTSDNRINDVDRDGGGGGSGKGGKEVDKSDCQTSRSRKKKMLTDDGGDDGKANDDDDGRGGKGEGTRECQTPRSKKKTRDSLITKAGNSKEGIESQKKPKEKLSKTSEETSRIDSKKEARLSKTPGKLAVASEKVKSKTGKSGKIAQVVPTPALAVSVSAPSSPPSPKTSSLGPRTVSTPQKTSSESTERSPASSVATSPARQQIHPETMSKESLLNKDGLSGISEYQTSGKEVRSSEPLCESSIPSLDSTDQTVSSESLLDLTGMTHSVSPSLQVKSSNTTTEPSTSTQRKLQNVQTMSPTAKGKQVKKVSTPEIPSGIQSRCSKEINQTMSSSAQEKQQVKKLPTSEPKFPSEVSSRSLKENIKTTSPSAQENQEVRELSQPELPSGVPSRSPKATNQKMSPGATENQPELSSRSEATHQPISSSAAEDHQVQPVLSRSPKVTYQTMSSTTQEKQVQPELPSSRSKATYRSRGTSPIRELMTCESCLGCRRRGDNSTKSTMTESPGVMDRPASSSRVAREIDFSQITMVADSAAGMEFTPHHSLSIQGPEESRFHQKTLFDFNLKKERRSVGRKKLMDRMAPVVAAPSVVTGSVTATSTVVASLTTSVVALTVAPKSVVTPSVVATSPKSVVTPSVATPSVVTSVTRAVAAAPSLTRPSVASTLESTATSGTPTRTPASVAPTTSVSTVSVTRPSIVTSVTPAESTVTTSTFSCLTSVASSQSPSQSAKTTTPHLSHVEESPVLIEDNTNCNANPHDTESPNKSLETRHPQISKTNQMVELNQPFVALKRLSPTLLTSSKTIPTTSLDKSPPAKSAAKAASSTAPKILVKYSSPKGSSTAKDVQSSPKKTVDVLRQKESSTITVSPKTSTQDTSSSLANSQISKPSLDINSLKTGTSGANVSLPQKVVAVVRICNSQKDGTQKQLAGPIKIVPLTKASMVSTSSSPKISMTTSISKASMISTSSSPLSSISRASPSYRTIKIVQLPKSSVLSSPSCQSTPMKPRPPSTPGRSLIAPAPSASPSPKGTSHKDSLSNLQSPVNSFHDYTAGQSDVTGSPEQPVILDEIDQSVITSGSPEQRNQLTPYGRRKRARKSLDLDVQTPAKRRHVSGTQTKKDEEVLEDQDGEEVKSKVKKKRGRKRLEKPEDTDDQTVRKCLICDKELKNLSALKHHMMAEHTKVWHANHPEGTSERGDLKKILKALGSLTCVDCGKKVKFVPYYIFHLKWCGREEEMERCDVCGREVKSMWMVQHERDHRTKKKKLETSRQLESPTSTTTEVSGKKRSAAIKARSVVHHMVTELRTGDGKGEIRRDDEDDEEEGEYKALSGSESDSVSSFSSPDEEMNTKTTSKTSVSFGRKFYGDTSLPTGPDKFTEVVSWYETHSVSSAGCVFSRFLPYRNHWQVSQSLERMRSERSHEFIVEQLKMNGASIDSKPSFLYYSQSYRTKDQVTSYCGGRIDTIEWCPTPTFKSTNQYAAVVCHMTRDSEAKINKQKDGESYIQIWSFGQLGPFVKMVDPKLKMSIHHPNGHVTSCSWCPQGAWQDPDTPPGQGVYRRLGLLAVGSLDGHVRIYSVPHPDQLVETMTPDPTTSDPKLTPDLYQATPIVVLRNVDNSGGAGCLVVAWQPSDGCNLVLAGYADGIIRLWNLASSSPLLIRSFTSGTKEIRPIRSLLAHSRPISCLTWNKRLPVFVSGGDDKKMKFWRLDNLDKEHDTLIFQTPVTSVIWPLLETGVVYGKDHIYLVERCSTGYQDGGLRESLVRYLPTNHLTSVWEVDFIDWYNIMLACDTSGSVRGARLRDLSHHEINIHTIAHREFAIFSTRIEPRSSSTNPGTEGSDQLSVSMTAESNQSAASTADHVTSASQSVKRIRKVKKKGEKEKVYGYRNFQESLEKCCLVFTDDLNTNILAGRKKKTAGQGIDCKRLSCYPIESLYSVAGNPNIFGSTWVLSGGESGLLRLHNLPGVLTPSSRAWFKKKGVV